MLTEISEVSARAVEATAFEPVRIVEIELGRPLAAVSAYDEKSGQYYRRAHCLVRLHTQPLGQADLELGETGVGVDEYAPSIWERLGAEINEHLRRDGLPAVTGLDATGLYGSSRPACLEERERFFAQAPFASVVVATRDRPERIRICLQALMAQYYPRYEIIVVDNAPSSSATADYIQQTYGDVPQVRYVREDRPGLSLARNCGIRAARGEIVAITDDDVAIDPYWLIELAAGFRAADDVACVTGLVLPMELETPAQFLLEEYGGFSKGFTRRVFDLRQNHPQTPLFPFTAGSMGTGASMALRAAFLRSVGGFDPALGVGTLAQGGEDIALFFQVISAGHQLVYAPAAVVYHPHRREYKDLRKQIYLYGVGLTAYLTKVLLDDPRQLLAFLPKVLHGLVFTLSPRSQKNSRKSAQYPQELSILELKGMLYGSFAYVRSRWRTRRVRWESAAAMRTSAGTPASGQYAHDRETGVGAGADTGFGSPGSRERPGVF